MQYIETPKVSPPPRQGADKYYGDVAQGYDAKREQSPKWTIEQKIIEDMLAELPKGSTVLDGPVGTGRFLDAYLRLGHNFIGVDKSPDMLVESALKLVPEPEVEAWVAKSNAKNKVLPLRLGDKGVLINGDVRDLREVSDKGVDAVVNCRISRWLSPEDCQKMFRESQRVARSAVIWTARVANHPHARSLELFEAALQPGWKIVKNVAGHEVDYRILQAQPA